VNISNSSIKLEDLGLEDHACFIYSTEEEHKSIMSDFIRLGLERNEKVFYVLDVHSPEAISGYLSSHDQFIQNHLKLGQFEVARYATTDDFSSVFDPERMLQWLIEETEFALAQGWSGLRLTIEMTWMQRGSSDPERLLEFERRSNHFFCRSKCMALCQYDQRQFNSLVLMNALLTHPVAIVGTEIYDNLYYCIAPSLMSHQPFSVTLDHCLMELGRYKTSQLA
jgi:hypothetical protein